MSNALVNQDCQQSKKKVERVEYLLPIQSRKLPQRRLNILELNVEQMESGTAGGQSPLHNIIHQFSLVYNNRGSSDRN